MQSPETEEKKNGRKPLRYRLVYRIIRFFSPKYTLAGTENLPDEPCVIVGNHCQMYGPLAAEFYMPRPHYIWCVSEMMDRKEVPAYAMQDFWYMKPKKAQWFYRLLGRLIAPLFELIFTNAHTIPVYHDARVMTTFRKSVERLKEGADIVIFPESREPYNAILWKFHEHFADLARLYYRRTGTALSFVPMYVTPALKTIRYGDPVRYDPGAPENEERTRICDAMMESITALAKALPQHKIIPYPNIPKDQYPMNTD